jgi:hypothetical protein
LENTSLGIANRCIMVSWMKDSKSPQVAKVTVPAVVGNLSLKKPAHEVVKQNP